MGIRRCRKFPPGPAQRILSEAEWRRLKAVYHIVRAVSICLHRPSLDCSSCSSCFLFPVLIRYPPHGISSFVCSVELTAYQIVLEYYQIRYHAAQVLQRRLPMCFPLFSPVTVSLIQQILYDRGLCVGVLQSSWWECKGLYNTRVPCKHGSNLNQVQDKAKTPWAVELCCKVLFLDK